MYHYFFFISLLFPIFSYATEQDSLIAVPEIIESWELQEASLAQVFFSELEVIQDEINFSKKQFINERNLDKRIDFLFNIQNLEEKKRNITNRYEANLSKIKYLKGLQVIKIIYEKVLGLDHHFSSVSISNSINKINNPINYSEFNVLLNEYVEKGNKKPTFQLPDMLQSNPIISMTFQLVNSILSTKTTTEKEKDIQSVKCIMDFTIRMNEDLKTIYFESEFLKSSSISLKAEMATLFSDYTKVLNYFVEIKKCRKEDDWESINKKLDDYLNVMEDMDMNNNSPEKLYKYKANLDFSIDRLIQFIDLYTNFVNQGEQYYKKFKTILDSYEHADKCTGQLPVEYSELQLEVDNSINKFVEAYKIAELKGSRMRDLLYGISEY